MLLLKIQPYLEWNYYHLQSIKFSEILINNGQVWGFCNKWMLNMQRVSIMAKYCPLLIVITKEQQQ